MNKEKDGARPQIGVLMVGVIAAGVALGSIFLGPGLTPRGTAETLVGWFTRAEVDDYAVAILHFRITRVAAACLVGAALAVAGACLQALLRNPLADPYILGIAAGGGFGAAVATALGVTGSIAAFSAVNGLAFCGALFAVGIALLVARAAGILSVHALLLAGVMVGAFFTSLILLILAVVPARDQHAVFLWLMGDLGSPDVTPARVAGAAVFIGSVVAALVATGRALDVVALGEEAAFHLGLNVERFKLLVLALASLATATAVALAGPIGFVGIVVPHILRRLLGPRHTPLLVASVFGGAALVTVGDTLVRVAADYFALPIIPVGVFTALVGAPYFLTLLRKRGY